MYVSMYQYRFTPNHYSIECSVSLPRLPLYNKRQFDFSQTTNHASIGTIVNSCRYDRYKLHAT